MQSRNFRNNVNNNSKSGDASGSGGQSRSFDRSNGVRPDSSGGKQESSKPFPKSSGVPASASAPSAILRKITGVGGTSTASTSEGPPDGKKSESKRGTLLTEALSKEGKAPTSFVLEKDVEEYGMILSVRSAFGFIQSIYSEESFYFSERDFYRDVKVGDLVAFRIKNGPKGPAAQNVRLLTNSASTVIANEVKGSVSRSHDRHRSNYGLIELDSLDSVTISEEIKRTIKTRYNGTVPFSHTAIVRDSVPKNHFLDRGDYVRFSITTFRDTNFFIAGDIRFLQLKRDRAIAQQIERMLAAGAVREVGVVSAVKNQEYGFIRAQDRKDELYFRIDDVENENNSDIKEGIEVEFFVIAEMIRGRLCERAIHLKLIPAGTVQFEVVVTSNAKITVLQEPGLPPADEIPGVGKLEEELLVSEVTGTKDLKIRTVDLWHRCMPEDLIIRKGDRLSINIHYYRPEKIFFARNVHVLNFFPLGRDLGQIVTLKEQAFGFIKSESRKVDLYFKSNQVIGHDGDIVPEAELKKGVIVTFDCTVEEGSKLRAVRVHLADPQQVQQYNNNSQDLILQKNILGVVVKNISKRDSSGLIKVSPQIYQQIQELTFIDPVIVHGIEQFIAVDRYSLIELPGLPDYQKKIYQDIIDQQFSTVLAYETLPSHMTDNFKTLKIWRKVSPSALKEEKEKADEKSSPKVIEKESSSAVVSSNGGGGGGIKLLTKDTTISFFKEDYISEDLGPLMNDMEVIFDICWDRFKAKKIAKNIRLTDEEIPPEEGNEGNHIGIIDSLIQTHYRGGFIRSLRTDERVFWMTKASPTSELKGGFDGEEKGNELAVDSEVSYELRKRGGLRCAVNVELLPKGSLLKEEVLPQIVTAVVVNQNATTTQLEAVLSDVSNEPLLFYRYIDLKVLESIFAFYSLQQNPQSIPAPNAVTGGTVAASEVVNSEVQAPSAKSESLPGESSTEGNSNITSTENNNVVEASERNEERVEYKAKYFPPLPRLSIPLSQASSENSSNSTATALAKPGDIITCNVVVNWALKRSPIAVNLIDILSSGAIKKRGRVNNLKFRIKAHSINQIASSTSFPFSPEQIKRYRLHELEWSEITEISAEKKGANPLAAAIAITEDTTLIKPTSVSVNASFYCLFQEIVDVNSLNNVGNNHEFHREGFEVGEEVEFWALPNVSHIAFGVTTLPRKDFGFGKGPGINDRLKTKVAATSVITMAKGPPTDSAAGFEQGWREVDSGVIAALPWAGLLSHLQA